MIFEVWIGMLQYTSGRCGHYRHSGNRTQTCSPLACSGDLRTDQVPLAISLSSRQMYSSLLQTHSTTDTFCDRYPACLSEHQVETKLAPHSSQRPDHNFNLNHLSRPPPPVMVSARILSSPLPRPRYTTKVQQSNLSTPRLTGS